MRYFGKRSISSVMSIVLNICWYLTLVTTILAPLGLALIIFMSTPSGDAFRAKAAKGELRCWGGQAIDAKGLDIHKDPGMSDKDRKDWERFRATPLAVRLLIFPYALGVLVLLLFILRTARRLFDNFKGELVFRDANVKLISRLSKLMIGFSIATFSLSSLLLSVTLLLGCEIIKNGTELQEEHDLTV